MPYQWAPLANKLLPTIGEYKQAYRLAEAIQQPDPRPLLQTIARLQEADSKLHGLIQTAHDAVTAFGWNVLPSEQGNRRAEDIARQTRERMVAAKLHHHFDVILDAEFFGLTAMHQVWKMRPGLGLTAQLNVVPATDLAVVKRNSVWEPSLVQDKALFTAAAIDPADRYIVAHYNPFKATRPGYNGGLLRSGVVISILKLINWQDWAQFNEIFSQPLRVAKYKMGTSDKDKEVALEAVKSLGKDAYALVSDDVLIEFINAVKDGSVQAYDKFLQKADAALAILINGETLTSEMAENAGSRAASQTHKLVSDDRMYRRLKYVEMVVNEQHIAVDYKLNVSETDLSLRPRFAFQIDDEEDQEKNARIVETLENAGYVLDEEEVSLKCGFTATRGRRTPPLPSS